MHTDPVTGQMVADPGDSLAPGIAPGAAASTETAGTSISRGGLTPDAQARLAAGRTVEQQAGTGLVDVARQAGQLAEQNARIKEEQANREAAVSAEYNARRLAAMDAADKDLAAARAAQKQAFDDYRNLGIHDFWSNKTTGRKIGAAIAVGLGGLNQRYNQGRNVALDMLNKEIEDDFARQREGILKAREIAQEAKGNVGDVASMRAQQLKELDIKEAAARLKVSDEMKARLASLGVPQAQIDANKNVLEQQQKAAEKLQKVDESERTHIVSTHTKALQAPGTGMVFGPGGQPLVDVGDKAKAVDVNKANKNYREINSLMTDLKSSYAKGVAIPLLSDEAQRREALQSRLLVLLKDQAQLGALSGSDMGLMEKQIGGPVSQFTGAGGVQRLGEMQKLIDRSHVSYLDSQGLAGAQVTDHLRGPAVAPAASPAVTQRPATAKAPVGGGLSAQDRARLMLHLRKNPNDPRADEIRSALGM